MTRNPQVPEAKRIRQRFERLLSAGVEIFSQQGDAIDLLLLDVVMPGTGGIEAYRKITARGAKVPVVFMTGYSSEVLDNSKAGMIDIDLLPIIQKPYTLDALGRIVRETLDAR